MNEVVNDTVLLARAQREIAHLRAKLWGRGAEGGGRCAQDSIVLFSIYIHNIFI